MSLAALPGKWRGEAALYSQQLDECTCDGFCGWCCTNAGLLVGFQEAAGELEAALRPHWRGRRRWQKCREVGR